MIDQLTLLRSLGRFQTKRVHPGGRIEAVDPTRCFDLSDLPVGNLDDLAALLPRLASDFWCCIVRGTIADPNRIRGVRRLLHLDVATGEPPTLCEVRRRWLALDVDHLPRPAHVPAADVAGCGRAAVAHLPPEFHHAGCIVQATASHGLKPGLRLRLWFWLDRAVSGTELKRWLRAAPVDHAIFGAAQPTYTAAPIFLPGAIDPIPFRFAMLPGRPEVVVPPLPPPRLAAARTPSVCAATTGEAFNMLVRAGVEVAAAEPGTAHAALLRASTRLARLVAVGALRGDDVRRVLVTAAERAGKPPEDAERLVCWSLARPPAPEMKAILQ